MDTAIIEDITAATVPIIMSPTFGMDSIFGCLILTIRNDLLMSFSPMVAALTISPSSKALLPASYSSIEDILSPGNIAV